MPKCCTIFYVLISTGHHDSSTVIPTLWMQNWSTKRLRPGISKILRHLSPAGLNGRWGIKYHYRSMPGEMPEIRESLWLTREFNSALKSETNTFSVDWRFMVVWKRATWIFKKFWSVLFFAHLRKKLISDCLHHFNLMQNCVNKWKLQAERFGFFM